MIAVYVVGALLWSFVLFAVLRRLAERRQARRIWQANRAEAERAWQERETERMATWRELQHAVQLAKLEAHQ
jgi:hypothetical protein